MHFKVIMIFTFYIYGHCHLIQCPQKWSLWHEMLAPYLRRKLLLKDYFTGFINRMAVMYSGFQTSQISPMLLTSFNIWWYKKLHLIYVCIFVRFFWTWILMAYHFPSYFLYSRFQSFIFLTKWFEWCSQANIKGEYFYICSNSWDFRTVWEKTGL